MIKIKICGITNLDDALFAVEHGADMIGFIFAESKRKVTPADADVIMNGLANRGLLDRIKTAAVFVNEKNDQMKRIVNDSGISYAQIHGDENPQECGLFEFPWYRALRINDAASVESVKDEVSKYSCPIILADTLSAKGYGGTGEMIDTSAACAMRDIVHSCGKEFFIAGGINQMNVSDIIRNVFPDGIDVSSGIEEYPGKKSHQKMKELIINIQKLYHGFSGEYHV